VAWMKRIPKPVGRPREGRRKDKMRNIRFDSKTYTAILDLAGQHEGWTFSKVVYEAVLWYISLSPLIQQVEDKCKLLAGKPLVVNGIKEYLQEMDAQLDKKLIELTIAVQNPKED
jgi:hypothetical protein